MLVNLIPKDQLLFSIVPDRLISQK